MREGTIVAGGTPQIMAGQNAARRGFFVQNKSEGMLWVTDAVSQGPEDGIRIRPGALYETPWRYLSLGGELWIYGEEAGQRFTFGEW